VERFIADIDRDRDFTDARNGGGIVGAVLDYLMHEGFAAFFSSVDIRSAHEWRQRFVLHELRRLRRVA
jgi:hypothetical protein